MSALTLSDPGMRRVTRLARTNALLMARNRLTLFYAVAMPLLPLVLLLGAPRGAVDPAIGTISTALLMGLVFPVYYNLLSMFVTRRDELVLKRLRTGELRDRELSASMALPGIVILLVVLVLTVGVAAAYALPLPVNPLLLVLGLVLAGAAFSAFALWTAAWTRTAESAQLTSAPVIVLATLGLMMPVVPPELRDGMRVLPGTALRELVQVAWFGRTPGLGSTTEIGFAESFLQAAPALAVLAGWTLLAMWLAHRSMRWEPRS